MRPARSIIGLAALTLFLALGLSACREGEAWSRSAESDDQRVSQIRPASQTVSERQRERRRARRDRTSRRFGRDGGAVLPHFADYAVHETGFSSARFRRAHGTLTLAMIDRCGDWTLQEKWDLDLTDQNGRVHPSTLLYEGSEIESAGRFEFNYTRQHLEQRSDFIGDVIKIDDSLIARFDVPEITDRYLPPDLMFPVTHHRQILSEALRGRDDFETTVFDGGNDFPYRAVTTIGQPLRADRNNPRVFTARTELDAQSSDRLPEGRHWPVRTDYFPLDDEFAPPVFTREFLLHESGIVLSFHFDYGDVQMDARLKLLDIRESGACPR